MFWWLHDEDDIFEAVEFIAYVKKNRTVVNLYLKAEHRS